MKKIDNIFIYNNYIKHMTDKLDAISFSDSEDEEEKLENGFDDQTLGDSSNVSSNITIVVKKTKKGKDGTYLTGIPKKEVTEVKDGVTVKVIKEVKVVLNELKQEFVKKNSTGCAVKENKPGTKNFISFIPDNGFYLFLQGTHQDKLEEFLIEKGYGDIVVKA